MNNLTTKEANELLMSLPVGRHLVDSELIHPIVGSIIEYNFDIKRTDESSWTMSVWRFGCCESHPIQLFDIDSSMLDSESEDDLEVEFKADVTLAEEKFILTSALPKVVEFILTRSEFKQRKFVLNPEYSHLTEER